MIKREIQSRQAWSFRFLEYLLYLTVLLIPLYVGLNQWFYSTSKIFCFFGIISVALLLCVIQKWKEGKITISFRTNEVIMAAFFILLTISGIAGVNPKNSFFGTFVGGGTSIFVLYFLGIFAYLVSFCIRRNRDFLRRLLAFSFASGVVTALVAFFQNFKPDFKETLSTVGNSSYSGAYLLLIVCIGIFLFSSFKKRWQRLLIVSGEIFICFSPLFFNQDVLQGRISFQTLIHNPLLVLGEANGAAVGIFFAVVTILFLWMSRSYKKIIAWSGLLLFVSLITGLFLIAQSFTEPTSRIHSIYIEQKSENRFIFWDIAKQGFIENPLLGIGLENYPYLYQHHFNNDVYKKGNLPELWVNHPHNIFLEYLSLSGILGLIMYCLFLGCMFVGLYNISDPLYKEMKILGVVGAGALVGYVIQDLFVFDTIVPLLIFFLLFGISSAFSKPILTFPIKKWQKTIVLTFVFLFTIWSLIFLVFLPSRESRKWFVFTQETKINGLAEMKDNPQDISLIGGLEDTAYASDLLLKPIERSRSGINENNKDYFFKSIENLVGSIEKEQETNPDNFRAQLVAGNLLNMSLSVSKDRNPQTIQRAKDHFLYALKINPQNPMAYFDLANTYALEGDLPHLYAYLRAGIATAPESEEGYAFVRRILAQAPNKSLEAYLNQMEERWVH